MPTQAGIGTTTCRCESQQIQSSQQHTPAARLAMHPLANASQQGMGLGPTARQLQYLESLLPTGLLLPVQLALTEAGLLNTSLLLALLPASWPPLKHSIA